MKNVTVYANVLKIKNKKLYIPSAIRKLLGFRPNETLQVGLIRDTFALVMTKPDMTQPVSRKNLDGLCQIKNYYLYLNRCLSMITQINCHETLIDICCAPPALILRKHDESCIRCGCIKRQSLIYFNEVPICRDCLENWCVNEELHNENRIHRPGK